jgi:hypothetical protein
VRPPIIHLNDHSGRHEQSQPHEEYETEAEELAQEENPFGYWRGIGNLAEARFAFSPDQLAGVEQREQREDHPGALEIRHAGREEPDDLLGSGDERNAHDMHEHEAPEHHRE